MIRQYMWGTDLSGTRRGAGGVGGLVKVFDPSSGRHFFPGYDGNGNVTVLADGWSGVSQANYEYGPFGELLRITGIWAKSIPFRFSTKYQDDESDMLYFGYRYYSPNTGKWTSRDPAAEAGGNNLYAFVRNDSYSYIDLLGLAAYWLSGEYTIKASWYEFRAPFRWTWSQIAKGGGEMI